MQCRSGAICSLALAARLDAVPFDQARVTRIINDVDGMVNFTDDVTLSGNSVKTIAANTVTIFDGKVVTILGPSPANVFTNHPNYTGFGGNGSTTGTFGRQGATTQPLNAAPGF